MKIQKTCIGAAILGGGLMFAGSTTAAPIAGETLLVDIGASASGADITVAAFGAGVTADGVTVTLTPSGANIFIGNASSVALNPTAPFDGDAGLLDFGGTFGGDTFDVTISGLNAGTYDFVAYAGGQYTNDDTVTFAAANGGGTDVTDREDAAANGDQIAISGVTVGVDGLATFTVSDPVSGNPILNAFQLTAGSDVVPEPSSLALLGLGGLALLRRRRG